MKVRKPEFDFTGLDPHWAKNTEFAQSVNGSSYIPTHIEPFLIKVMNRSKQLLDPETDADLIADIAIFNKQEGAHFRLHGRLNRAISEAGYPGLAACEARLIGAYNRMLATKSLRYLLAFCLAFESLGPAIASQWVDEYWADELHGADRRVADLWAWHYAEEFEHRTVVYQLWNRLYGKPRILSYLWRLLAMVAFMHHSRTVAVSPMVRHLIDTDRAAMTPAQVRESKLREEAYQKRNNRFLLRRVLGTLTPGYDPERARPPRNLDAVLARYE